MRPTSYPTPDIFAAFSKRQSTSFGFTGFTARHLQAVFNPSQNSILNRTFGQITAKTAFTLSVGQVHIHNIHCK